MKKFSIVILLILLFVSVAPTFAGGWSIVTLDRLPTNVVAGQPQTIGFIVRQHGVTPVAGLSPKVVFHKTNGTDQVYLTAVPDEIIGHYTTKVTLPSAGAWSWEIDAYSFPAPMPTLMVGEPVLTTVAASPISSTASSPSLLQLLGISGLVGAAGATIVLLRTRASWAAVLVLGGVLLSVTGFVMASMPTSKESISPNVSNETIPAPSGKDLFLAKGCATCHTHSAVDVKRTIIEIGPNLTNFSAAPDYLQKWLKNPASIKPQTQMPTLGLGDDEIEALIIFINNQ